VDEYLAAGGKLPEIRRILSDYGLTVPTMIYLKDWFDATGRARTKAIDACRQRMEMAAEIGAPAVIAGPPSGPADREQGAENYRELLNIGAGLGVRPAFEFLGFVDEFTKIEDALDVMVRTAHPDACTVLDPAHIYRGGGSVESISKLTASQIAVCHFDDCPADVPRDRLGDSNRVMPGDGVLDLAGYLQRVREIGYAGFLSLELFRPDLWAQDPVAVARQGIEKMRNFIER
jgi:sugar phosphate isomerase/epimerase